MKSIEIESMPQTFSYQGARHVVVEAWAFHQSAHCHLVFWMMQEQALARLAVAPPSPDFLVVGFEAGRKSSVDDRTYVGTVDAHAERVGRDDGPQFSRSKSAFGLLTADSLEAGMVTGNFKQF